ncbi:MAG: polysaccharide deacetylase family protein [Thermoleophilia bacterium]|nr:polysaccharide deacetylase family protein [Thermoleophilia bacterium]
MALQALARTLANAPAADALWGRDRLSVLAYHRVLPDGAVGTHDPDLVSATPQDFAAQMAYVARNFSVVSVWDLADHITDGTPLPQRPALITFDDGYVDNFEHALPVLREHDLPSVVFLATDFVDSTHVPWWDRLADIFARATPGTYELPMVGTVTLDGVDANRAARVRMLAELKAVGTDLIDPTLALAQEVLDVAPATPDRPLFMSWDQVTAAQRSGMDFQPHTVSHPILTRVDPDRARAEVAGSCARVTERTGRPCVAMAYPNGSYDDSVVEAGRDAGLVMAFTMELGPVRGRAISERAMVLPRVPISRRDDMCRFRLHVQGTTAAVFRAAALRTRRPTKRSKTLAT